MKKNKLFTLLFCVAACVSCASAEVSSAANTVENALALAVDSKVSVERVCVAVAEAVQGNQITPAELVKRVIAARKSWSAEQVAALYKSVLMASPSLSASFVDDVTAFEKAGKPTSVGADAAEGVKVLAALYGAELAGVNPDTVLASVAADSVGAQMVMSVAPLRDVGAQAADSLRRPRPVKPTPPATSSEN